MISKETRKKLIAELEKDGNILNTCRKVGISPATFYRWRKSDAGFRKRTQAAIDVGRQNMTSVGEHALMLLVKEKYFPAIKWFLQNNSKRYKPKPRSVRIEHSRYGEEKEEFEKKKREEWDAITEEWKRIGELINDLDEMDEKKDG